jgi:hypothetical protein
MYTHSSIEADNWNRNGHNAAAVRVLRFSSDERRLALEAGPGWRSLWCRTDEGDAAAGDCWLLESAPGPAVGAMLQVSALPVIVMLDAADADGVDAPALIDIADGFLFADDDPATIAALFARVTAIASGYGVRDVSDAQAGMNSAFSTEADRIASGLARLATDHRAAPVSVMPVDATSIRRHIRLRRDRDRFFPAEIFGDPAWDMLLDLMAAQLEGRRVPVSSLCIAASVPTTTALRWIRSLTEAGLFVRRVDPDDARRAHVSLSSEAATAMQAWMRLFSEYFAPR